MKKYLWMLLVLVGEFTLASCSKCSGGDDPQPAPVVTFELEEITALDKECMVLEYSDSYIWYETQLILNDYLDSDSCDGSFNNVLDVYQYVNNDKPYVVMFTHAIDADSITVVQSSWLEDVVMPDSLIKLTYKEAFDKAMASDLIKPHSIHAVLRRPLGPVLCNPQYVFGNIHKQIWVDALTGECSESNPAFKGFEWVLPEDSLVDVK